MNEEYEDGYDGYEDEEAINDILYAEYLEGLFDNSSANI